MRAAIYNPYLDTLGGGERYTLVFAQVLLKLGYSVDVFWHNQKIREKLENRFGLNLQKINFVKDINRGDGYDICFWVSDGSVPTLKARYNYLHFQVPFTNVNGKSLLNKMKFFRIRKVVCNSHFTKKIIDSEYGVDSVVVYPPVSVEEIKPLKKENLILSVGRFSQLKQSKRQDVLIDVFKKMHNKGLNGWGLVLAGGTDVGADKYFKRLKKAALGYPITLLANPDFFSIKKLFGKARIFWTACGFEVDETKEPEKVEHFGIAVVEAMAARSVPVAYGSGGHRESIQDKTSGYLWTKKNELAKLTFSLCQNKDQLKQMSDNAMLRSKEFSIEHFEDDVKKLVSLEK